MLLSFIDLSAHRRRMQDCDKELPSVSKKAVRRRRIPRRRIPRRRTSEEICTRRL